MEIKRIPQLLKQLANRIKRLEDKMSARGAYRRKEEPSERTKHPKKVTVKKKKSSKVQKVMHEFKEDKLHSGSKKGPEVKSRPQAIAIALSEARKAGEKVPAKKKK